MLPVITLEPLAMIFRVFRHQISRDVAVHPRCQPFNLDYVYQQYTRLNIYHIMDNVGSLYVHLQCGFDTRRSVSNVFQPLLSRVISLHWLPNRLILSFVHRYFTAFTVFTYYIYRQLTTGTSG